MQTVSAVTTLNQMATSNIAPRLRMLTLYTIGAAEGRLVAGTGNRSEAYMGYFTKWGDGGSMTSTHRRPDRDGNLRVSDLAARAGEHHPQGAVRRPLRGPDGRAGDGRDLRRH